MLTVGLALVSVDVGRSARAAKPAAAAKATTASVPAPHLDIKQWTLANGLKVLFVADHKAPVVTVQVFYHAGGKDEPAGKRGIAHMFEHMMFKGSTHVAPEEHARFIALVGGETTRSRRTTPRYHDTVPPSALDFTMKLEAERMRNLKLTQKTIDSERQVVEEELRKNVENNPIGKALRAAGDGLHGRIRTYRRSAREDLDTVTPADCQKFYDVYYRPNNAALIVVGDTDEAPVKAGREVLRAAREGARAAAPHHPKEPAQTELRDKTLEIPVQLPVIIGGYHIPAGDDPTSPRSRCCSRSCRAAIRRGCISASCARTSRRGGGRLRVRARGSGAVPDFALYLPNMDVEKLKAALDEEIAQMPDDEGRRARAAEGQEPAGGARASISASASPASRSNSASTGCRRTIRRPFTSAAKFDAVTADDVSAWPRSTW